MWLGYFSHFFFFIKPILLQLTNDKSPCFPWPILQGMCPFLDVHEDTSAHKVQDLPSQAQNLCSLAMYIWLLMGTEKQLAGPCAPNSHRRNCLRWVQEVAALVHCCTAHRGEMPSRARPKDCKLLPSPSRKGPISPSPSQLKVWRSMRCV